MTKTYTILIVLLAGSLVIKNSSFADPRRFPAAVQIPDCNRWIYLALFSLKWQLFSSSVILKYASEWLEWYDTALIPYIHYVPFKSDLTDLADKINWLKKNNRIAKKIAEALVFALQNLTPEVIDLYINKLMVAYSSLLKH